MLDWKNRAGSAGARTADTSSTKRRGYLGNLFYSRALGALILIYLLVALAVGWYWSKEPALFPVQQRMRKPPPSAKANRWSSATRRLKHSRP